MELRVHRSVRCGSNSGNLLLWPKNKGRRPRSKVGEDEALRRTQSFAFESFYFLSAIEKSFITSASDSDRDLSLRKENTFFSDSESAINAKRIATITTPPSVHSLINTPTPPSSLSLNIYPHLIRGQQWGEIHALELLLLGKRHDCDMEKDEIQGHARKFPRVGNGRNKSNKIGSTRGSEQYQEEEEDGEQRRNVGGRGGGGSDGSTSHFQNSWHHSSRIIRVSRASGGKDRHSKVMTSKGLRDRRVRLSVTTAIQFYDLQDRLGYDQPSKAVEWLINAAQDSISELPSLKHPFPDTPQQPSDKKRPRGQHGQLGFDDAGRDTSYQQNQNQSQNLSLSKSACSSTSETSKGSGLSLSRSEIRVNRVKARDRATKDKEKEKEKEKENKNECSIAHHRHNASNNHMPHTASFTELLTGGIGSTITVNPTATSPNGSSVHQIHDEANLFNKGSQQQHWSSTVTPMDHFSSGILVGPSSSARTDQHQSSAGFQLGHALPIPPFSAENHSDQLQHFSFMPDHLNMSAMVTSSASSSQPSGGYNNLNFSISSGLVGYNRGTLQSNFPSFLPHMQRFQSIDGSSNIPFFIGAAAPASAPPAMDNNNTNNNHHQI
ncbi:hypothetical protein Fmac_009048 [Flemingia macrophylla]|uniref:TCP domain-containing protein n=1 Tax=Flemingia macrophylla TaxID=520843 RepID=A0ABD1MZ81_9FABA